MPTKRAFVYANVKNILLGLLLTVCTSIDIANAKELSVAIDHYPPWIIAHTKPYSGIDIEIVNEIANALSLKVNYVICPMVRCLKMLKNGQVDLIPGVFKTPERAEYLEFIEPAYAEDPAKVFYVNKNKPKKINKYEDLQTLTIGVKRGVSYFKQFDDDHSLNKFVVNSEVQLFNLLKIGRIDTFISHPSLADYYMAKESLVGEFSKATFKYGKGQSSYIALSKKSHFVADLVKFQKNYSTRC